MHPKEPSDATLVQIENKGGVYSSLMEDLSADLEDNLADVEIDDGSGDIAPPQDVQEVQEAETQTTDAAAYSALAA